MQLPTLRQRVCFVVDNQAADELRFVATVIPHSHLDGMNVGEEDAQIGELGRKLVHKGGHLLVRAGPARYARVRGLCRGAERQAEDGAQEL